MRDLDAVFAALAASPFRMRQKLNPRDAGYLDKKGLDVVVDHARDFVAKRLAPAQPTNDGKQTPMRSPGVCGPARDGYMLPIVPSEVS